MSETHLGAGDSPHRLEALSDGIYAVALTLLVIELKLPPHDAIHSAHDLAAALAALLPKFLSWVISFLALALFWYGQRGTFSYVQRADGRLNALTLGQLALVSLMPFSSALAGEHAGYLLSQIVYSINLGALGLLAWLTARHVMRHPQLSDTRMPLAAYHATRMRTVGLMLLSALAVAITLVVPGLGNIALLGMAVVNPWSRIRERRQLQRD